MHVHKHICAHTYTCTHTQTHLLIHTYTAHICAGTHTSVCASDFLIAWLGLKLRDRVLSMYKSLSPIPRSTHAHIHTEMHTQTYSAHTHNHLGVQMYDIRSLSI